MFEDQMQELQLLTSFGIKCSSKCYEVFIECLEDVSPLVTALKLSKNYVSMQCPIGKEVLKLDFADKNKIAMLHQECGLVAQLEKIAGAKLHQKEKSPYIQSEAKYLIYSPPDSVRYEVQHLVTTTNRTETHIFEITADYCLDSRATTTKLIANIIISKSEYVTIHVDESLTPYEKVLIIGAAISFVEILNRSFLRTYGNAFSIVIMLLTLIIAISAIAGLIYYCAYNYCRGVSAAVKWCGVGEDSMAIPRRKKYPDPIQTS